MVDSSEQIRIQENDQTIAVLRGHGGVIASARFAEGGAALVTLDGKGAERWTHIEATRPLSWPEREHLSFGASAWQMAGKPALARFRDGRRFLECSLGLAAFCPLSRFRDSLSDGTLGPEMIVIPSGKFLMGSPVNEPNRNDAEGPQREVTVPRFALARTEVTVAEYRRFAEATGHEGGTDCITLGDGDSWRNPGFEQTDADPVVCVSWEDTQAYIVWLNSLTPGAPYRLPSEAEWEYAARSGSTAAYPFGEDAAALGDHAWFTSNSGGRTQPVGGKLSNASGLHDMLGNAWEWNADCWHGTYANAPSTAEAWLEGEGGDCSSAVLRGGSWVVGAQNLRSAGRDGFRRDYRLINVGFRLARTLPD